MSWTLTLWRSFKGHHRVTLTLLGSHLVISRVNGPSFSCQSETDTRYTTVSFLQDSPPQKSFSRSLHNPRLAILPTLCWPCHWKFKKLIKSTTLKNNPFYQWHLVSHLLTPWDINNEENCKKHGNTKLALMPLLPTLCVCKKLERPTFCLFSRGLKFNMRILQQIHAI